ncbi:MAG: hypothetical protein ACXW39_11030, partial [Nitrospira sp.]
MNQHPLFVTVLAGVVMAAILASPTGIEAAAKSSPKASSAGTCESTFKHSRPTLKTVSGVLQSHARWLQDRESPNGQRANLCRTD